MSNDIAEAEDIDLETGSPALERSLPDNQPEFSVQEDEDTEDDVSEAREVDVFVSYRLDPDATKAAAFANLLRKTLAPRPNVFVSGDGGLVPSNVALKSQLLAAFRPAKAVVAIITHDSKNRDWVLYEAGAAWGCEKLYSPLLIGVEPESISTTMTDFVCTKATDPEQVRILLQQIAKRTSCTVRSRLGASFAAFVRKLTTDAQQEDLASKGKGEAQALTLKKRAKAAWESGNKEEAERFWSEASSEAEHDKDAFASVRLHRITTMTDDSEEFERLLQAEPDHVRSRPRVTLWRGIFADHVHEQVRFFGDVLSREDAPDAMRSIAREWLAHALFSIQRSEEATSLLLDVLSKPGRPKDCRKAAALLCENLRISPESTLMLRLVAYKDGESDQTATLSDLTTDQSWPALAMCFATKHDRAEGNGSSKNTLGRATLMAGFPSLAFQAFSEAAEQGVSVAKVNLGIVHQNHSVPAAGLAVLREHEGPFEVANPDFPHQIRAELERSVASERTDANAMIKRGRRLVSLLVELVSHGWSRFGTKAQTQSFCSSHDAAARMKLIPLFPFTSLYEIKRENKRIGFAAQTREQEFLGLLVDLSDKTGEAQRIQLKPVPEPSLLAIHELAE